MKILSRSTIKVVQNKNRMTPSHVMEKTYNTLVKMDGNFCSPIMANGKAIDTNVANHIFPAPIETNTWKFSKV
ncbi:hypothetical protein [Methanothermobacter tenebrarum]|uniref:hypothetical protein n=1 Tax=Methanothermobacter tenebrarum TaxID=680118 RepID=UPI0019ADBB64|nr:hypothetical protein [Methanothermobacter tenebrarum]MBC7101378.1 hypothetical protein [Methanobacteriales archaeon]MBC7118294.1 hypothetical protein [Methanobacteriaceae archaeon]